MLSRRQLLAAAALGGSAVFTGSKVSSGSTAQMSVVPDPTSALSTTEKTPVIVVGAGLAGLSAGIELAERGFQVTILEAGSHCGGRVAAWESKVDGDSQMIEHGFHAFFDHYYSLWDLIQRACNPSDFEAVHSYPLANKGKAVDSLSPSKLPFPLNLMTVAHSSPNLKIAKLLPGGSHVLEFARFDGEKTYEKWDHLSFESWCKEHNVADSLFEVFYKPFARALLNPLEELSAAEMISLFHSYFTANPEGLGFSVSRKPSSESLIDPLIQYFEQLGGQLQLQSPVQGLAFENDTLLGVTLKTPSNTSKTILATLQKQRIPSSGFLQVDSTEGSIYLGHDDSGELIALGSKCSHQGCPVAWSNEGQAFHCPCHGGKFSRSGAVLAGPPPTALKRYKLRVRGETLEILGNKSETRLLAADHVVLAVAPKAASNIANNTLWPSKLQNWKLCLSQAQVTAPYIVARFFFDKGVNPDRPVFFTASGYKNVDVLALFDRFQGPSQEWAKKRGGSVVEAHAYALKAGDKKESILEALWEDIVEILPELAGAKALHTEVQYLQNFPAYGVGQYFKRPTVKTPCPQLHLAGDWIRTGLPVALMEAAVVSGRLAANNILSTQNLRMCPIKTVPLKGILA